MDIADEARDPLCGREVANGRYFIERVLGKGGMGTVYAALQRPIDRKVALKLIHRELIGNAEVVGRFLQEMRLTATIEHPHTVRLYDFGDIDGQPFLTTELLQGRTLRVELASAGAFAPQRLGNVGIQIAKALRAAHEQGVVHRDLKPDNVMLLDSYGERDYVKVLDFGIARSLGAHTTDLRTRTGMLLGTPAYMSPEQCEGRAVDARSDLYSLGVVLFELATGAPPFPHEHSIPQLLMDHVAHPPPDVRTRAPGLDEPLAGLIMALLEKQPEQRPVSAEAVVAVLAPLATVTTEPQWRASAPQPSSSSSSPLPAVSHTALLPGQAPPSSGQRPSAPPRPRQTLREPEGRAVADRAVVPLPRRAQAAFLAVVGLLVASGVGAWLWLRRAPSVPAEAVAAALSRSDEPAFPVACVSRNGRPDILAAATGRGAWAAVPADRLERLFVEARAADLSPEAARAKLEKVVAGCPSFALARTLLGKALARLDQDEAALAQLEAASKLAPGYATARFDLAVILVKHARASDALHLVTALLKDDPGHGGARLLRGQIRLATGDKAGAVEDLQVYTVANPQAGAAWAMLGEARAQLGQHEAAEAAFCRALDLGVERVRERCPRR